MKFLKNMIVLSIIAVQMSAFGEAPSKQDLWNAKSEEVNEWGDGLGMGLDEGIKETVIALNLLGFKTRQSCEGHLERASGGPWVDFDLNDEIITLGKELNRLMVEQQDEEDRLTSKYSPQTWCEIRDENLPGYEKVLEINAKFFQLAFKIEDISVAYWKEYYILIENFYKLAPPQDYDATIVFKSNRFINLGTYWQSSRTYEEKAERLKAYQNEMNRFGKYLKEQFLQN